MGINTDAFDLNPQVEKVEDFADLIRDVLKDANGPNIGDFEDTELIDLLGYFRGLKKIGETYEKAIAEILKGKLPVDEIYQGSRYEFFISTQNRTDIDRALIKEEMGEDWYEDHCTSKEIFIANCRPIKSVEEG